MTDEQNSPKAIMKSLSNSQLSNELMADGEEKKNNWGVKEGKGVRKEPSKDFPLEPKSVEEVMRMNECQDVEMEFYFNGKLLDNSTCFYDVWKQNQENGKKKSPAPPPKYDKSDPSAYF